MRLIALLLMLIACNSAATNWVKIGNSVEDGFVYYADPASIRRAGDYVKMWVVYDYQASQVVSGQQFLSTKLQFEYDCNAMQARMLYAATHTGKMANSDTVAAVDNPTAGWGPVLRASLGERLWKFACKK